MGACVRRALRQELLLSTGVTLAGFGFTLDFVEQSHQRSECMVAQGDNAHVSDKARRINKILAFAVAVIEARENTQHLEMALHAHPFEIAVEAAEVGINRQTCAFSLLPIA